MATGGGATATQPPPTLTPTRASVAVATAGAVVRRTAQKEMSPPSFMPIATELQKIVHEQGIDKVVLLILMPDLEEREVGVIGLSGFLIRNAPLHPVYVLRISVKRGAVHFNPMSP